MTDFRGSLETICDRIDGIVCATLMGMDGLAVETVTLDPAAPEKNPVDVDALLVEYSALLDKVHRSSEAFAAGDLQEISIRSEHLTAVIRLITHEYFVAVALRPEANPGKARYVLRVESEAIALELS